jgi:hypothetical protein
MSATRSSSHLAAKPHIDYFYFEKDNEYYTAAKADIPVSERFIKLLRKDEIHNNFQYKTGLNVDSQPWCPDEDCAPGGIYFCRLKYLPKWIHLYDDITWCRWVTIPTDAEVKDSIDLLTVKANKVILSDRIHIIDIIYKYFDTVNPTMLNPIAAPFIDPFDPKCIESVRNDTSGTVFRTIMHQTPELCIEAVNCDWTLLEYVWEQTPEICMEAIKKSGSALKYVRAKTQKLCAAAVEKTPFAIQYVPTQFKTFELCMSAASRDGYTLLYIPTIYHTRELCAAAIKQNKHAAKYMVVEY